MSETEAKSLDFVPGEKPGAGSVDKPATDAATAHSVLKQIEYYFSEGNLPKDKFLMAEIAKDEAGFVDLSVIAGFNRIKQLLPSGSVEALAEALKASKVLVLSDDSTKVRRPDSGRKKVTLGGTEFGTRDEVIAHARALIASGSAADGKLEDAAVAFVKDIFAHHEKKAEKEGAGLATFKVGRNPAYPETSCFVIVRTDDTEADFSYLKCLDRIYGTPAGRSPGGNKRKRGGDEGPSASKSAKAEGENAEGGTGEIKYDKGKIVVFKNLPDGFDRHTLRDQLGGVDSTPPHHQPLRTRDLGRPTAAAAASPPCPCYSCVVWPRLLTPPVASPWPLDNL